MTTQESTLTGWRGSLVAVVMTIIATGISIPLSPHLAPVNLAMVYLLGVTFTSALCSIWNGVLGSLLAVLAFDVAFVPPVGQLTVHNIEYLFTFGVMLIVSLSLSTTTARLRAQANSTRAAELQSEVESLKTDLLSSVSHDLRTPLSSITGSAAALLAQHDLGEGARQLATTIQDESERMARLINNLLDMTRVQGLLDLELDWHAIDELAANAVMRTEAAFDQPVVLKCDRRLHPIRVDGVLIEQVIVNVLENCARHAGRTASVIVSIGETAERVTVEVVDDGPGIGVGEEERIFDRFTTGGRGGTGLGLAICRAVILAHGGTIRAERRPVGMAILIELPRGPLP